MLLDFDFVVCRLSEANMQSISSAFERLYMHNSRAILTEALTEIILDACTSIAALPERLVMELCVLVAVLHVNVGNEIGTGSLMGVC
jgi:nucleolar MIF4G domain-containing protein 1